MKKIAILSFAALIGVMTFSCKNGEENKTEDKKVEELKTEILDLVSFNESYKTLEFTSCDEFEVVCEDFSNVFFTTLDKADQGDETAIKDIKVLKEMMGQMRTQLKNLKSDCPEKMETISKDFNQKLEENQAKFDKIFPPKVETSETNVKVEKAEKTNVITPQVLNSKPINSTIQKTAIKNTKSTKKGSASEKSDNVEL
jgi:uncharacterized UPF0160 family protein